MHDFDHVMDLSGVDFKENSEQSSSSGTTLTGGGGKLSQEFFKMLSAESQHLLQRFQKLPLKEKKIVFMLAGDIIAETDNDLELSADEQFDQKCYDENYEQQEDEKLDIELFGKLSNFVKDVLDGSSTTGQLLTVCQNQGRTIKHMTIANANAKARMPSAIAKPYSMSTPTPTTLTAPASSVTGARNSATANNSSGLSFTLPSLEYFLAKQSKPAPSAPAPKRKGKSGTFAELYSKPKSELITSYLTEFRGPPKPKLPKPNPSEVEEFNDMFMEEAKPEEVRPNTETTP